MLTIEQISCGFGRQEILHDISLTIPEGKITAIVGQSGCGKTTFLKTLNRMIEEEGGFYKGKIILDGEDIKGLSTEVLRTRIGMVFQQPIAFPYSIEKNLSYVLKYHGIREAGEIERITRECLQKARLYDEIKDQLKKSAKKLSGGQKQRVGIARALTTTPDILLCDEATSALDPQTTEAILKLLKKINREMGVTILLITHQMQVVQMICNKVAVMEKGQVVEAGSVLDVFGKPQAPVTKRFVQTVVNDQIPESIISLVKEQKEHFRVERLKFIGSSVKRPVISDICHVEGIVVNILGATVQELQDNIMCVFILQLLGSEEKILKAEKQIDENGVIRERVEVI